MIYGHIATATGWTFFEIDQLTLWDVEGLFAYWKEYPPVHILVHAYMAGPRARKTRSRKHGEAFGEVERAVIAAGGQVKRRLPDVYRAK